MGAPNQARASPVGMFSTMMTTMTRAEKRAKTHRYHCFWGDYPVRKEPPPKPSPEVVEFRKMMDWHAHGRKAVSLEADRARVMGIILSGTEFSCEGRITHVEHDGDTGQVTVELTDAACRTSRIALEVLQCSEMDAYAMMKMKKVIRVTTKMEVLS